MSAAGTASAKIFDARVLASYGRNHVVGDDAGRRYIAVRRGKRGDVAVGDRVRCSPAGDGQAAIEEHLPRTSLLYRADAWRSKELAANVDLVAVVCAARPAFNLYFLSRALIAAAVADLPSLVSSTRPISLVTMSTPRTANSTSFGRLATPASRSRPAPILRARWPRCSRRSAGAPRSWSGSPAWASRAC